MNHIYVLMCEEELCTYPVLCYTNLLQAQKEAEKRNLSVGEKYARFYIVQTKLL